MNREAMEPELPDGLTLAPYSPSRGLELVKMWRASFERGVGVIDPHPLEEQLAFLDRDLVPRNSVILVLDGIEGPVVAFIAFSTQEVAQLYVHVDHQGRGIGKALLGVAKARSSGRLRLFTFARNGFARRFYERNGFVEVAQGFELEWQLEDIEYAWVR